MKDMRILDYGARTQSESRNAVKLLFVATISAVYSHNAVVSFLARRRLRRGFRDGRYNSHKRLIILFYFIF